MEKSGIFQTFEWAACRAPSCLGRNLLNIRSLFTCSYGITEAFAALIKEPYENTKQIVTTAVLATCTFLLVGCFDEPPETLAPGGRVYINSTKDNGAKESVEARYQELVDNSRSSTQQAAEAYRRIGVLASLHDTDKALNAYRKATELDPRNTDGWNSYGSLLRRSGNLKDAEKAHRESLRLGQLTDDIEVVANAYSYIGFVYQASGDLGRAEAMYKNALAIDEARGSKKSMAYQFGSLGIVYQARNELSQAEAMYKRALALFQEIGAVPQAEKAQEWLNSLAKESDS